MCTLTRDLVKFDFKGNSVTTITDAKGNPWFVAKEVCGVLGYKDSHDGTKYLDKDELSTCPDNSSGQVRHILIINESGLYTLILRSRKPEAKEFRKWVTSEVLPAIRKTGGYIPVSEGMTDMEILSRAVLIGQRKNHTKPYCLMFCQTRFLERSFDYPTISRGKAR